MRFASADAIDFSQFVPRGGFVVWGQACAEPTPLTEALVAQRETIGGLRAFVGASLGASVSSVFTPHVSYSSYLAMGANGALARAGDLEIQPCAYSELPRSLPDPDLLILQLARGPDGRLRYALACEYLHALCKRARTVLAEINEQAPWSPDSPQVDAARLSGWIETSRPPLELRGAVPDEAAIRIGRSVAGLIEDGSTLQVGIGNLPDAALAALTGHRDLGIHSGAIGDGVAALIEAGAVTNARKPTDAGVTVAGAFFGGARLFALAHANRSVALRPTSHTHDLATIMRHDRFVSLNSAIEIDLSGQVNAEVAGGSYVGGVGGAVEFARAAALSRGGVAVLALNATASGGRRSRIVPHLRSPVTVGRADAGVVVTEFGVADLRGRSLTERRRLLVELAHPDFRAELDRSA